MEIVNPGPEDYHIHSINYSDGMNTVDEIVQFAGKIGLKKIAICDHSDATNKLYGRGILSCRKRPLISHWKNFHNDVEVIFGVEADILNENGDICETVYGKGNSFLILSAHTPAYAGDPAKITEAYINAMERHHAKIKFICHPNISTFSKHLDVKRFVAKANELKIPIELNTSYLEDNPKADMAKLREMLKLVDRIYVNSDAHSFFDMKFREEGFKFLKREGFLK